MNYYHLHNTTGRKSLLKAQEKYLRSITGDLDPNYSLNPLAFEDKVPELMPIIVQYVSAGVTGIYNSSERSKFFKSYQDALHVCYTKDSKPEEDMKLSYDHWLINATELVDCVSSVLVTPSCIHESLS